MPTPHIEAPEGAYAKTVLMPGDPLRAKFIAQTFLTDAVQVNGVRGMLGFTGKYKGKPVSVQGSGMGCPSMGIYSYELFHFYGVDNIIRVGTTGSIQEDLHIGDLVIALGACTNSNFAAQYQLPGTFAPIASFPLVKIAQAIAQEKKLRCAVGNVASNDTFYDDVSPLEGWKKMGVLAFEMESTALYCNAARAGKNAMTLLTVSDELLTHKAVSPQERQTAFTAMMEVALETAAALDG
ncbi:purine-nucleoside phosphorylase [Pseudoflavonifractor sp. 524-17]|uniref:purine-nucleoside phosphorylase n=1 Tax=Pseudoflavonifractor sp. 524-17 TaxID=2304577 RepID=UPI001379C3C8|nr:purine-nucleoside phosphorylase [Pseudoflavonifractor sp. 524-17]NCE65715.1 purine-nucleoside phosphorylase [Pseudoflavonifractor sp. 524-17]